MVRLQGLFLQSYNLYEHTRPTMDFLNHYYLVRWGMVVIVWVYDQRYAKVQTFIHHDLTETIESALVLGSPSSLHLDDTGRGRDRG